MADKEKPRITLNIAKDIYGCQQDITGEEVVFHLAEKQRRRPRRGEWLNKVSNITEDRGANFGELALSSKGTPLPELGKEDRGVATGAFHP